ncbi:MAG TPA: hypothetical protein VH478_00295 [Trebonia sp.]|nr:hypothetical protein [Trebonia sp.]
MPRRDPLGWVVPAPREPPVMPPELPPRRPSASLPGPVREAAARAGRRRRIDPRVLQRVRDALLRLPARERATR